ncbi:N-acetyl sugar amidotransferase [Pollutimonas bauzanensis]|uniref:N-acetyl sugar amidotransferase n=1 Tax=Pollutimonas bauzanensis TaxID=658167 RepID=A0A1M5YX76_9BURK|nr:N-acetyl sugar amidotransferase [Pollutimonas bauzanensis]SHI16636.1 N-acetyl sugar amidotransferase [Pollutimonas bauzanensis]
MNLSYQVCSRCVMDTSAADISFDAQGVCNYCSEFLAHSRDVIHQDPLAKKAESEAFIAKVKAAGKGKRYDCVVGVSGGVDSSWVLFQAVEHGLRPLAVHMDNGWNSELAQHNIANLVQGLGVDLHTHVIDWGEYKRLMQAFFDADVIDVELLYDNAMLGVNYQQAARHKVNYILSGSNQATEGMRMPPGWNWFKYDKKNIKALAKKFGAVQIRTFPAIGTLEYVRHRLVNRIQWTSFLDMMPYNKFEALAALAERYGYKPYPYKHYESIFTRFYQGYILPNKFGVDKRRLHLGTLVSAGQMTREQAMEGLKGIAYLTEADLERDKQYFMKKMGWSPEELADYIGREGRPHHIYGTELPLWEMFQRGHKRFFRH